MIIRFKHPTSVIVHDNICCFSGGFETSSRQYDQGDTVEVLAIEILSGEGWEPCQANSDSQLKARAFVDNGTLHPDRLHFLFGDVEVCNAPESRKEPT